jgi:hypothetical protein
MAMFDFLTVGKTLKSFAGELTALRLETETLVRELEDVKYAPAHPDDVIKALEVWASDNAIEYRKYLKLELGKLFQQPSILLEKSEVKRHLHSRGFLPDPSPSAPVSRDMQMCGLLGPVGFMELMKKQIQLVDWPAPGLPLASRPAAIAALEKKLKILRTREADLIESANKAGLVVS